MALPSFIFGGSTGRKRPMSPKALEALRQSVSRRAGVPMAAPRNIGEGLTALGQALAFRFDRERLARMEREGEAQRQAGQQKFGSALGALLGGDGAFPQPGAAAQGAFAQGAAQPSGRAPEIGDDIREGIAATASSLGVDPVDLATAISYETGGTFDPAQRGPTTKWGQHKGLIQFGEPQALQYGVDWNDPVRSQLGAEGAIAKYLRATGVKPGMGLLDIYSAINAGGVGRYNRSDAQAGGAPGTVRDKVEQQMAGHRARAQAMFEGYSPQGTQQPVQVASLDPGVGVLGGGQQPAQGQMQGVQTAQAGGNGDIGRIMQLMGDQYATPQQKSALGMLLQQRLQGQDPMRRMQLQRGQLELSQMRNPPPGKPQLVKAADGYLYNAATGERAFPDVVAPAAQPKLTDDMQEYEFARSQGFEGSFTDFMQGMRKAGATSVNVNTGQPNIPEYSKLPPGYVYRRDPVTGQVSLSDEGVPSAIAVPGSPQAIEAAAQAEKAESAQEMRQRQGANVLDSISRARELATEWSTTGTPGFISSAIPGTPAYDLKATLDTIKSNVAFDRLQAMRDASPTGGALGQVSERELALLQAAIASLEQSQSREQFLGNLKRVEGQFNSVVHGPQDKDTQKQPAAPPTDLFGPTQNNQPAGDPLGLF